MPASYLLLFVNLFFNVKDPAVFSETERELILPLFSQVPVLVLCFRPSFLFLFLLFFFKKYFFQFNGRNGELFRCWLIPRKPAASRAGSEEPRLHPGLPDGWQGQLPAASQEPDLNWSSWHGVQGLQAAVLPTAERPAPHWCFSISACSLHVHSLGLN